MSLNKSAVMDRYYKETGKSATYKRGCATFHFLSYVDWLESFVDKRAAEGRGAIDKRTTNKQSMQCPNCGDIMGYSIHYKCACGHSEVRG